MRARPSRPQCLAEKRSSMIREEKGREGEEGKGGKKGGMSLASWVGGPRQGRGAELVFAFLWSIAIRAEVGLGHLEPPRHGGNEGPGPCYREWLTLTASLQSPTTDFGNKWSMLLLENSLDRNWPVLADSLKFWNHEFPPSFSHHSFSILSACLFPPSSSHTFTFRWLTFARVLFITGF